MIHKPLGAGGIVTIWTYLYVVLLVTRTHQAVVYDIPTAAAPENAIAVNKIFRVAGGLSQGQSLFFSLRIQKSTLTNYA